MDKRVYRVHFEKPENVETNKHTKYLGEDTFLHFWTEEINDYKEYERIKDTECNFSSQNPCFTIEQVEQYNDWLNENVNILI